MPQIGTPPQVCNCPELVEKLRQQKKTSTLRKNPGVSGTAKPRVDKSQENLGAMEIRKASELAQVLPNITPKPQISFDSNYGGKFTIQCKENTYVFSTPPRAAFEDASEINYKSLKLEIKKPDNTRTVIFFNKQPGKPTTVDIDEYPDRTSKKPSKSVQINNSRTVQGLEKSLVDPAYAYVMANVPKRK